VLEIAYGLAKSDVTRDTALVWFTRLATSDMVSTLPFDGHGAVVAGRLRAAHPHPPTGARRAGTKPDQRAGWVIDLQIAACTWTHGHALVTHNRQDFDVIAAMISGLYPTVPTLEVLDPPAL
jgi:predicted nucleic acid-binding protein